MANCILSGGEYGGLEVDSSEFINHKLTKTDSNGNQWIYDSGLANGNNTAELVSYIPASEVQ
jgi:hypothetical protein